MKYTYIVTFSCDLKYIGDSEKNKDEIGNSVFRKHRPSRGIKTIKQSARFQRQIIEFLSAIVFSTMICHLITELT